MLLALLMATALQADAADDFPKKAYVVLQCIAGPNETVSDCRVVEVSHPGQGLEGAAISRMRLGHIGQRNGVGEGQTFRIRVAFRLADENDDLTRPQSTEGVAPANPN